MRAMPDRATATFGRQPRKHRRFSLIASLSPESGLEPCSPLRPGGVHFGPCKLVWTGLLGAFFLLYDHRLRRRAGSSAAGGDGRRGRGRRGRVGRLHRRRRHDDAHPMSSSPTRRRRPAAPASYRLRGRLRRLLVRPHARRPDGGRDERPPTTRAPPRAAPASPSTARTATPSRVRMSRPLPECQHQPHRPQPGRRSPSSRTSPGRRRGHLALRLVRLRGAGSIQFKEGSNQWWTAVQIHHHAHRMASLNTKRAEPGGGPAGHYNYFVEEWDGPGAAFRLHTQLT